jgi:hypothetical protein
MHEREKLNEAKYFLRHMEASVNSPDAFQYELSAFLSAARSVLQYALEESKQKPNGQRWYETQVSGSTILKFFKDKRDINIHTKPVGLSRLISVSDTLHVSISESARIEITREDGIKEIRESKEEPRKTNPIESSAEVKICYILPDWDGPEDAIQLSRQYLTALEAFVNAGTAFGLISG